jgi:hypothetical protein
MPDQPLVIRPFSSDKEEIENCLVSLAQALTAHGMILQHGPHGMILAKVQSPALRVSRAMAIIRRITPPQVEYAQITNQTDPGKIEVSKPQ